MTSLAEALAGGARRRRSQAVIAGLLMLVVALSVVPLGSNRPFFWAFWPLLLGVVTCSYSLYLAAVGRPFRTSLRQLRWAATCYGLICATLVLQLAPLGDVYWGGGLMTPAGVVVHPPFISTMPGETLLMLLRWLGYGLTFFLAVQVANNSERRLWMLRALVFIVSGHAVLGLLSFHQWGNTILGVERWAYLDSVTGTFVNRNSFATFLAIGLTITTAVLLRDVTATRGAARLTRAATYSLCLLFQLAALLGTNSRMGLLVGVIGPAVVLACYLYLAGRRQAVWALLLVGLAAVAAVSLYGSGVWTRFFELERSGQVRFELYQQVWDMILRAPWLGYGGGSFEQAYPLFHRPPVFNEQVWDRAHNTYLALWSELGLIAGSLPLVLLLVITFRVLARRADRLEPAPAVWLGTMAVAGVHSLVDFSLEMFSIALLFSALAGIATAAAVNKSGSVPTRRQR